MIDEKLLEVGFIFHGHKCPAMPLGIRAGSAALKKLEVERASNKELFCLMETGPAHAMMCFGDGVQTATGCTFGKGNIINKNYTKNAFTLINMKNKKAVRVALQPEFQERKKGIEPKDVSPELLNPMIENIKKAPDEMLFNISEIFDIDFQPPKGTFEWYNCEECGEFIFANGVKIKQGKKICIPCSKK